MVGVIVLGLEGKSSTVRPLASSSYRSSSSNDAPAPAPYGEHEEAEEDDVSVMSDKRRRKKKILPLLQYRERPKKKKKHVYGNPPIPRDEGAEEEFSAEGGRLAQHWPEMLRGQEQYSRQVRRFDGSRAFEVGRLEPAAWGAADEDCAFFLREKAYAEAAAARAADEALEEGSSRRSASATTSDYWDKTEQGHSRLGPVRDLKMRKQKATSGTTSKHYAARLAALQRQQQQAHALVMMKKQNMPASADAHMPPAVEVVVPSLELSSSVEVRAEGIRRAQDRQDRFIMKMTKKVKDAADKKPKPTPLDATKAALLDDHRRLVKKHVAALMPESQAIYSDDKPVVKIKKKPKPKERKEEPVDEDWLMARFETLLADRRPDKKQEPEERKQPVEVVMKPTGQRSTTIIEEKEPSIVIEEQPSAPIVVEEQPSAVIEEQPCSLAAGVACECRFEKETDFYPGSVLSFDEATGLYEIGYDDGDHESGVVRRRIRLPGQIQAPLAVGDAACCLQAGTVHPAHIVGVGAVAFDEVGLGRRSDVPRDEIFGLWVFGEEARGGGRTEEPAHVEERGDLAEEPVLVESPNKRPDDSHSEAEYDFADFEEDDEEHGFEEVKHDGN